MLSCQNTQLARLAKEPLARSVRKLYDSSLARLANAMMPLEIS